MNKIVLLCFLLAVCLSKAENCDNLGISFYEELNCKPVAGKEGECPSHYTSCEYKRSKDKCRFRGKEYDIGSPLPSGEGGASAVNCVCRSSTEKPSFGCAIVDCAENFGITITPGCYRRYQHGKLCSVGEVCPPSKPNVTCNVDGKEYREGEKFYPKGTCKQCICDAAFDGKFDAPTCQNVVCGTELRKANELEEGCAPAYYYFDNGKTALCCPDNFICSDGTEKIIKSEDAPKIDAVCKYGSLTLQKGDYFLKADDGYGKSRELNCTCTLPPFVTCTGKY